MSIKLIKPAGATHKKKRIGCGNGSGHGGTSTKGHKGAQARKGYSRKIGFEGGQLPLIRRIPKRGFKNGLFKKEYQLVDLEILNNFEKDSNVSVNELYTKGFIDSLDLPIKILNNGRLNNPVNIILRRIQKNKKYFPFDKISKGAKELLEKIGGKINYQ
ncbi:MAG: 50S ribosomal protein L15 [Spirochaetes bacterium]|nr:50S ribosomal protein L15 [Spirochaetota bacterium]